MIFLDKSGRLLEEETETNSDVSSAVEKVQWEVNSMQEKFMESMNDDFNTSQALAVIFEAIKKGNDYIADGSLEKEEKAHMVGALKNFVLRSSGVLGLSLTPVKIETSEADKIEKLVELRQEARKNKDFSESDRIRDELLEMGIVVEDTPEGPVWRKK